MEPAINDGISSGLRAVPVSDHNVRALHQYFARLAGLAISTTFVDDLDFGEVERFAGRAGTGNCIG